MSYLRIAKPYKASIRADVFTSFGITSFQCVMTVITLLMVLKVDQLKDIFYQVNAARSWLEYLPYIASITFFSLSLWWTSRFILDLNSYPKRRPKSILKNPSIFARFLFHHYGLGFVKSKEIIDANKYAGRKVGKYLPRIYATLPLVIIGIFNLYDDMTSVGFVTLCTSAFVGIFVTFRRRYFLSHKAKKITSNRLVMRLLNPWTWTVVLIICYSVVAFAAITNTQSFAKETGAAFIIFWGLASVIFSLTLFVYIVVVPTINLMFFIINVVMSRVRHKFHDNPRNPPKSNRVHLFDKGISLPYPIVTIAIIFAALMSYFVDTDNHQVRKLQASDSQVIADSYAFSSLASALDKFHQVKGKYYYLDNKSNTKKVPMFFVVSQGGGLRASYWSAGFLSMLESRYPGIHKNIFSLSGASGGTVGNVFFTGALHYCLQNENTDNCRTDNFQSSLLQAVGRDYLSTVATSFMYNDLLYRFLPLPFLSTDRATYLEQDWEIGFKDTFSSEGLGQGFQRTYLNTQDSHWLPLVLSMGSIQESGSRVITAPFPVKPNVFRDKLDIYPQMGCKNGNLKACNMRLSTVGLNSARFPYITPAGTLDNSVEWEEKQHILDGGYFDNYGAHSTADLVRYLKQSAWLDKTQDAQAVEYVPVVIVLKNSVDTASKKETNDGLSLFDVSRTAPYGEHSSWPLNEMLAPIQGIVSVRAGHTSAAMSDLLHLQKSADTALFTDDSFCSENIDIHDCILLNTLVISYSGLVHEQDGKMDPPLGWWLSPASTMQMDNQLSAMEAKTMKLMEGLQR